MKANKGLFLAAGLLAVIILMIFAACAPAPTPVPATAAPTVLPQPIAVPPTATATTQPGAAAADVEKLVNSKFNTVNRDLALWNIQPGLGTVMIEYGNRLARLWFAANADNWDMAKYQLDEMTEIQEVGETTRPARAPMLKAFEDNYLKPIDKAIAAKDKGVFIKAFNDAVGGCNGCHKASTGSNWKSYQYVTVAVPKIDPAFYIDWKGGGQDSYIANPPPAPTAAPKPALTGNLIAAGVEKLVNDKFNKVDRDLALWNIQPGLGTVMIEYGNRFSRLFYAARAGNWDMARYQLDEMTEIQEVGETTRPARAPMLQAFEKNFLSALDNAIAAKDGKAFDDAYAKAVGGCNACHTVSTGSNWKSYKYVKIQAPTKDNNDYLVWKADKGTGSYIANPPVAATATPKPPLTGVLDMAGVEKLVNAKFNTVDRDLALWNIQPGLGTVMIEYGRRSAQLKYALDAGNWDMAKYQLDEMTEIQEVGETTRPSRAPMLKAFEDANLKPMDDAIAAKDKDKASATLQKIIAGCNACHVASKGSNWASYAYVQMQLPQTDPADYLQWNAGAGNTGNYVSAPPSGGATPPATTGKTPGTPPQIPASHASPPRPQCLVCHLQGVSGAPKVPSAPDHNAFNDDPAVCTACHVQAK